MDNSILPRGVRNNNPGNLVKNDTDKWQGLAPSQDDPKFFQFADAVYGIRALARTLIKYQDVHDCHTPEQFINRWAPPGENDTSAYVAAVCNHMTSEISEYDLHDNIDMHEYKWLRSMVEAIIEHENGHPWMELYTSAQIDKALVLAGVEPPKKSLMTNPQVIGSAIAGAATVAGPIVSSVQAQIMPLVDYSTVLKQVFVVVTLLGIVITIIAKLNERKRGIS